MREFALPDAQQHAPADTNHAINTTLLVARNEHNYTARVVTELAQLPPVACNVGELNQVFSKPVPYEQALAWIRAREGA